MTDTATLEQQEQQVEETQDEVVETEAVEEPQADTDAQDKTLIEKAQDAAEEKETDTEHYRLEACEKHLAEIESKRTQIKQQESRVRWGKNYIAAAHIQTMAKAGKEATE